MAKMTQKVCGQCDESNSSVLVACQQCGARLGPAAPDVSAEPKSPWQATDATDARANYGPPPGEVQQQAPVPQQAYGPPPAPWGQGTGSQGYGAYGPPPGAYPLQQPPQPWPQQAYAPPWPAQGYGPPRGMVQVGGGWVQRADYDRRIMAHVADSLIIIVVSVLLGFLAVRVGEALHVHVGDRLFDVLIPWFFVLAFLSYWCRDILAGGRSLGKRYCKLEILDINTGLPAPMWKLFLRQFLTLGGFPIVAQYGGGLIDGIVVVARQDGRKIGDLLFGTVVVRRQ